MAPTSRKTTPWLLYVSSSILFYHSINAFSTHYSSPIKALPSSHLTAISKSIDNSKHNVFTKLIQSATKTLLSSDVSENEIEHSYGSASQGQWICSRAARKMQMDVLEGLVLMNHEMKTVANDTLDHVSSTIHEPNYHDVIKPTVDSFILIVQQSLNVLIQSDVNKPDGSSSQGRWVDAPSGESLGKALDRLVMNQIQQNGTISSTQQSDDEQRAQWLRWMKNVPSPLFLDLTSHVHELIIDNHYNSNDPWISTQHLDSVDMSLERYISRIGCHVILLPSGAETSPLSLVESTGAHVYGKLLYGGVNRFRLLTSSNSVRRVGEKRESISSISGGEFSHPSWVQLGGTERRYEALDIGPAAVLELTLLPRQWQDLPTVFDKSVIAGEARTDMVLSSAALGWDPSKMLRLLTEEEISYYNATNRQNTSESIAAFQSTDVLSSHFRSAVGGLQPQIDAIIRRVLDGRSIYSNLDSNGNSLQMLEAVELAALGLQPVRGLLLYGKPGVGKTLLIREIAKALGARPPKIVSAPELLDRWVGGSERLVRELFREAEEELMMCKMASGEDDQAAFLRSALHVVVIDEIDAVFRRRIDTEDSGSITRSSVVNQLLSKLDGVNALPNVLMIGMTNRIELLDDALLRPGRLEVKVEVPLPNESGRREILQIHFGVLRSKGRLSFPLCCAIDGVRTNEPIFQDWPSSKRQQLKILASKALQPLKAMKNREAVDLASSEFTGGFSGADIAGLVRNAGSIALARSRSDGSGVNGLLITLEDVMQALAEVKV
ncbi:hypothetical protein ACHAWO_001199 [Cyclotella atomus]|uniref:Vesicle-fusing ATPase n=1 Tax=Cyclotella atomus TaxID=382360 RepID=A0ABD3MMW9_9STRA